MKKNNLIFYINRSYLLTIGFLLVAFSIVLAQDPNDFEDGEFNDFGY